VLAGESSHSILPYGVRTFLSKDSADKGVTLVLGSKNLERQPGSKAKQLPKNEA